MFKFGFLGHGQSDSRRAAAEIGGNRLERRRRRALERSSRQPAFRPLVFESLESRSVFSTSPFLVSLAGTDPAPATAAASLTYAAVFSETVTGVDLTDFVLVKTGSVAASITQVAAVDGATYTITISGIIGDGTLGIHLVDDGSIRNSLGERLDTTGVGTTFLSEKTYAVSASPTGLTQGDVNGDGKLDLLVATDNGTSAGNVLQVLLGNGDGTFQSPETFAIGRPSNLTTADLNDDGKLDVVVTFTEITSVGVLLGNGDGTFQSQQVATPGIFSSSVATIDVNGDGIIDLVGSHKINNNIQVMLGNGDGTFRTGATLSVGNSPAYVVGADLNGDDHIDLVVSNLTSSTVSALFGNGDGSFTPQQTVAAGNSPGALSLSDLNGDTLPDLVVNNNNGTVISVLLGNGNGTFQARTSYASGSNPRSLGTADIDGDGKLDVVVANLLSGSGTVSVLFGNGNGSLKAPQTLAVGLNPTRATIGDFNGDGRLDIVAGNSLSNSLSVLTNAADFIGQAYAIDHTLPTVQSIVRESPSGQYTNASSATYTVTFGETVSGVDAADFQLALSGTASGSITQVMAVSGSAYTVTVSGIVGEGTIGLNLIDDGTIRDVGGNRLNTAGAPVTFVKQSQTYSIDGTPYSLVTQDINGDGKIDFISTANGTSDVYVYLGNGDGTFQLSQSFFNNAGPKSIAAGDLNGDGKLDLVTSGSSSTVVGVQLGNGDGTFGARQTFTAGSNPLSVATGDFNGDGKLDVVSANYGGNVSVLRGNGDGSLQAPQTFATLSTPMAVTAQDVNGDGKLDLIVANKLSDRISVLIGNGDATFKAQVTYAVGADPHWISTGDLNGDGNVDLVVATHNGNVGVLLGNGNGTFKAQQTYAVGSPGPWSVEIADLNRDGKLDLVTSTESPATVSVLFGNGNGTFQARQTHAAGDRALTAAVPDIDGDGRPDLLTVDNVADKVSVFLNVAVFTGGVYTIDHAAPLLQSITRAAPATELTNASSVSYTVSFNEGMSGIDSADFVVDTSAGLSASPTVVVTQVNASTYTVTVHGIVGNGTLGLRFIDGADNTDLAGNRLLQFQDRRTFAVGAKAYSIATGDVNGDGKLDLVSANLIENSISVLLGNGDGTFQTQQTFAAGSSAFSVALGDVDGDGKLDAVVAANATSSLGVLIGNGDGTFKAMRTYVVGGQSDSITLGDINNDGKLDIGLVSQGGGRAVLLLNNGNGTFQPAQSINFAANAWSAKFVDVDVDGKLDLVAGITGGARVLLGNGNGTFKPALSIAAGTGPNLINTGDFNGDGKLDLIVVDQGAGTARTLLGNGDGTFAAGQSFDVGALPGVPTLGDLNGDGKLDLVVGNRVPTALSILYGNGDGTFQNRIFTANVPFSSATAIADWNGDGRLDIASASLGNYQIGVFLGFANGAVRAPNYQIDQLAPTVVSIVRSSPTGQYTNGSTVTYTVTFDQAVANVDLSDFVLKTTGTAAGTLSQIVALSPTVYTVTITGVVGDGTLALHLIDDRTIRDAAGNLLTGPGRATTFFSPRTYALPVNPTAVVMRDVNGDGIVDLIAVENNSNNTSNALSVLLGNGDGTFQSQQSFAIGTGPSSVATGDVNGDGIVDLLVSNEGGSSASLLLGNGNGTFKSQTTFAVGTMPSAIVVGDFNADGLLDMAVTNRNANAVSLLIGNGNGTFKTRVTFAVGNTPTAIVAADVNNDGKLDLAVANNPSTVSVLLGNGNGTFQAQRTTSVGSSNTSLALGDLDGDGKLDLVVANTNFDVVGVYLGNANGTFKSGTGYAAGDAPASVKIADVDGDGKLDVVLVDAIAPIGAIGILSGNGDGTLRALQTYAVGSSPKSLAIGDLNGDGRPELVAGTINSSVLAVLQAAADFVGETYVIDHTAVAAPSIVRNGAGVTNATSLSYTVTFAEDVVGVDASDFLVVTSAGLTANPTVVVSPISGSVYTITITGVVGNGTVRIDLCDDGTIRDLAGNSIPTQVIQQTIGVGSLPYSLALGDLNGDGRIDIVTKGGPADTAAVLLGNGDGNFIAQQTFGLGLAVAPVAFAIGDFNGDGKADVLSTGANRATVLLGNGNGTFQTPRTSALADWEPKSVSIGDFNADGKLDLVFAARGGAVIIAIGSGDGTFSNPQQYAVIDSEVVRAYDVDGDGKLDLVSASQPNGLVSVLLGNGNGTFKPEQTYAVKLGSEALTAGDFNGDGKLDLATANGYDGSISVLLGNGNGTFQTQRSFVAGTTPRAIGAADFNGDGRVDLAYVNSTNAGGGPGTLKISAGNGDGTFAAPQTLATGVGTLRLETGDINGDGRSDVVVANVQDGTLGINLYDLRNTFGGPTYTVDQISPRFVSFVGSLPDGATTNSSSFVYTLTFDQAVVGVDVSDFAITLTSSLTASAAPVVAGSGSVYTVTVSGTAGVGTYSIRLIDDGTIRDAAGNRLDVTGFASFIGPTFISGNSPLNVVSADLNGDGKLDIVSGDGLGTFSTMLGNGDGTFQSARTFSSTGLNDIRVADVNDDGKLDIVAVMYDAIGVLLGNGDGTFQAAATFSSAANPISVGVADFNGDDKLDIVTSSPGTTYLLLGNGDGTFQAKQTVAVISSTLWVEAGDFNGDGKADLAVSTSTASSWVLLGNGNGTFQAAKGFGTGNGTRWLKVGDFNADGKADLYTLDVTGQTLNVLLGNGNGTFQARRSFTVSTGSGNLTGSTGDFNGDGNLDIALPSTSGVLTVLYGNGDGNFVTPLQLVTSVVSRGLATGDFNADGRTDIALAYSTDYGIYFGTRTPNGLTYTIDQRIPSLVSIARAAGSSPSTNGFTVAFDVTFDSAVLGVDASDFAVVASGLTSWGNVVVTAVSPSTYTVVVNGIVGNGTIGLSLIDDGTIQDAAGNRLAYFFTPYTYSTALPISSTLVDLNQDGRLDIVVPEVLPDAVRVFLGNGDGTFQTSQTYAVGNSPSFAAARDLNADGFLDLIVANSTSATVSVLLGNGNGTFQPQQTIAAGSSGVRFFDFGDVNGDGKVDIVVNGSTSRFGVLLGNGDGTFQAARTLFGGNGMGSGVFVRDFNGDGSLDIAAGFGFAGGGIGAYLLLGNGDGTFQSARTISVAAGSSSVMTLGDADADGKLDLEFIGGDKIGRILRGNGDGTFQAAQTFSSLWNADALKAVDINLDGKQDLVYSGFSAGTVGIALGNGDGTFQALQSRGTGLFPTDVGVGDLNADGRPDLIVTSQSNNNLGIWLGGGNGTFTGESYAIDQTAPTITGVYARGVGAGAANWSASFLSYLAANELGDSTLGFELSSGGAQLKTLPWTNVNTISIRFSEAVTVAQGDLSIIGSANGPAAPAITGFSWDAATQAGTWTFAAALPRGKFLLHLDGTPSDGAGNGLDGEWAVSSSTSSGNGTAGGDFNFRFNVLPGDFDGSNGVTITEVLQARNRAGKGTASVGYTYREDTDGSGGITITEILQGRNRAATSITGLSEPVAPGSTPQRPLELTPLVPGAEEGDYVSLYPPLTQEELAPLVAEAIARWEASGLVPANFDWSTLRFAITDLGPAYLGLGNLDGSILLDDDGASWGWFVDDTPSDDGEFAADADSQAARHMDLLTVVMHEIGHALGYPSGSAQGTAAEPLMSEFLGVGTRRTPSGEPTEPALSDLLADEAQAAPMLGFARLRNFDFACLALREATSFASESTSVGPTGESFAASLVTPNEDLFLLELPSFNPETETTQEDEASDFDDETPEDPYGRQNLRLESVAEYFTRS